MPLLFALSSTKGKGSDKFSSFTLIELLIVVAIIGILAALIIVSVTTASAKARDIKRQEDLRNIQKALEMYYTTNGSYPSTGGAGIFWGNCSGEGSHPMSGSNGYVPGLAPAYIPSLPIDPRQGSYGPGCSDGNGGDACYGYASDGTNYQIRAHRTVEILQATSTNQYAEFYDPGNPCTYALYNSAVAKAW